MIEESHQVLLVLGNKKNHKKPKERPGSTGAKKPGARRPSGTNSLPFGRKRPDRFPEGPIFDRRSRNGYYNY